MFRCKDLLSLNSMSQAQVIAGEGGMEKGIRWSYKAENLNFEKWVHGQELLIISSPVTQRKNFDLYNTIQKAIELNMSCALLLVGDNYVSKIDSKVVNLAEKNDFPLFTMPWNVPLLDFFEELGHAIVYLDEKKDMQDSFLAEIIFGGGTNTERVKMHCEEMGIDESALEQIFVMHIDKMKNDEVNSLAISLQSIFQKYEYPSVISSYGDRIVGFMSDSREKRELIEKIFQEFVDTTAKEMVYTLSIGPKCERIADLGKSFREISKINTLLEHIHKTNQVVFYDQIGYYRMLLSYDDKGPMKQFMEEVLGSLLDYDAKNKTQLVETLWIYFESGCNMIKAAEELYSHKNTVKYRLQRIQEITGRDLSNQYQSFELYNALIIYYYLK